VSPVKYELAFYIPQDDILHSQYRENLKSYTVSSVSVSCGGVRLGPLLAYCTKTPMMDNDECGAIGRQNGRRNRSARRKPDRATLSITNPT
jgi:hypothetical protein